MNKSSEAESNIIKEQELTQAVITLSDEIWPIEDSLNKASLLLQAISEGYFEKFDEEKEKDRTWICYEFSRYSTYTSMIEDYVFKAKQGIKSLTEREEQAYRQEKETKTA